MQSVMIVLMGIAGMSFGWFVYSKFIAEKIYQLQADPAGFLRYEVEYTFMRRDEPVVAVRFERQAEDAPMVPERVVLAPGRVPRGEYRIVMRVRDLVRGSEARTTLVNVELR